MSVNITEKFVRFLMKQSEEQSARIAELSFLIQIFRIIWRTKIKRYEKTVCRNRLSQIFEHVGSIFSSYLWIYKL